MLVGLLVMMQSVALWMVKDLHHQVLKGKCWVVLLFLKDQYLAGVDLQDTLQGEI